MNWERILAETLVEPHWHDDGECYRMDCEQTTFALQGETLA